MPVRRTVGRVGRAHGIRGEVTVEVRTDEPERRLAVGAVLATDPPAAGPLTIAATRWHSGRLLVGFAGVVDRAGAEGLRGVLLEVDVDPDERPEDPDQFYDQQLVGLTVAGADGEVVGQVAEVVHLPGQDLLAVRRDGRPEVLVPLVAAIVAEVDLDTGRVVITPPPGLLELGEGP